mgnify:CR=1 FL=1
MGKFKVISSTLTGMFKGKNYKKDDEISEAAFGPSLTKSLVSRGFLKEIKEEKVVLVFSKLTVAELKEKIIELGAEPVDGKKADLIKQLEDLV